ncbi:MAG: VOC family protein [Novosphingobium sp.]|nr:VOC family protein [Novosphingobium sp.]
MIAGLNRPAPIYDPGKGLLHNDHFQVAYVTDDLERAVAVFRERFGVGSFRESDAELESGATIRLRVAWIGAMAYEIICATGPGMELYTEWLPENGSVLRHHHFGFLVADEPSWAALEREIARAGVRVRKRSDTPGFGRTVYVEVPELGHCLEYIMPGPGLLERLNATPAW